MAAQQPASSAGDELLVGLCMKCDRKTYVHHRIDLFCPVCSSPLKQIDDGPGSAAE